MDVGGYVQGGVLGLLGLVITVLFTVRATNKVKNENAGDDRKSRYEELVQDRLDSALQEVKRLNSELSETKDGRALLERRLRESKHHNAVLLEMLEKDQRESAARWVQASELAPLDELPRKK